MNTGKLIALGIIGSLMILEIGIAIRYYGNQRYYQGKVDFGNEIKTRMEEEINNLMRIKRRDEKEINSLIEKLNTEEQNVERNLEELLSFLKED